jgi:type 1 glutamine amidotransferase
MRKTLLSLLLLVSGAAVGQPSLAERPQVVAFFDPEGEIDHYFFAEQAIRALGMKAATQGYGFTATSDWGALLDPKLKNARLVIFLNGQPHTDAQRAAFQRYMDGGGGWLGFHISGFTRAQWPWYARDFIGGGFGASNWPALPSMVHVDAPAHPVMQGIPSNFMAPINEWYSWSLNPRANPDIQVLLTLDGSNYPLGIKNMLPPGDVPVVWTNRSYRMLYVNYGHGDRIFASAELTRMIDNSILWLLK